MNVPFRFSFGDLVDFTNSIITLTRELKSPALASSANSALITELKCLHSALVSAERCISSHQLVVELQDGLKDQVQFCSQTLSEFATVLRKYNESKAHGGLKNRVSRLWMKIMVGIRAEKEKERLREGIRTYIDAINCYLAMGQADSSRRILLDLQNITRQIESMQTLMFSVGLRIPMEIGDPALGNSRIGSPNLPVSITLEFRQPFVCRPSYTMPHTYESFKYTRQVPRGTLLCHRELSRALREVASEIEVQPRPHDDYINSLWWDFNNSAQYRRVPAANGNLTLDSISLDDFSTDVIFSVQSQENCCWTAGNWNSTSVEFLKWASQPSALPENSQLSIEYLFSLDDTKTIREIMESDPCLSAELQDPLGLASRHITHGFSWGQFAYEIEELS